MELLELLVPVRLLLSDSINGLQQKDVVTVMNGSSLKRAAKIHTLH